MDTTNIKSSYEDNIDTAEEWIDNGSQFENSFDKSSHELSDESYNKIENESSSSLRQRKLSNQLSNEETRFIRSSDSSNSVEETPKRDELRRKPISNDLNEIQNNIRQEDLESIPDNLNPTSFFYIKSHKAIILLLFFIIFIVFCYSCKTIFFTSIEVHQPKKIISKDSQLSFWIKDMENKLPNQPWTYLKYSIGSILKADPPRDPAVLLLIVPQNLSPIANCFANFVKTFIPMILESDKSVMHIDASTYSNKQPADVRWLFDNSIKSGFSSKSRGLIVDHVELLPFEAAMMLHEYCDNDNAPYKRVLILFLVHIDITEDNIKDVDNQARNFLRKTWTTKANEDQIDALLARIAPLVALIKNEPKELLSNLFC